MGHPEPHSKVARRFRPPQCVCECVCVCVFTIMFPCLQHFMSLLNVSKRSFFPMCLCMCLNGCVNCLCVQVGKYICYDRTEHVKISSVFTHDYANITPYHTAIIAQSSYTQCHVLQSCVNVCLLSVLSPPQLRCPALGAAHWRGALQGDRWTSCGLRSSCQQTHPAHSLHLPRTLRPAHGR